MFKIGYNNVEVRQQNTEGKSLSVWRLSWHYD